MSRNIADPALITAIQNKATHLRIESVRATTEAGSGHPSSCCSAADIVATLFFSVMSQASQQRSLHSVERPRGAASLRGLG